MDIGEERERIVIEPAVPPLPRREPPAEPAAPDRNPAESDPPVREPQPA